MFCFNFVKSKLNDPVIPVYSSISNINVWDNKSLPVDTLPKGLDNFIKDVKTYNSVKHNFQKDVDNNYLVTPKDIILNNLKLDNQGSNYSNFGTMSSLNVNDVMKFSKSLKSSVVNKFANDFANQDLNKIFDKNKNVDDLKNNDVKKDDK